ncbi:glycoside hydrolase domain-containing protein [Streptomyces hirsutus]|uniref:glycoside hydrolase domain-containing protein n=1 Tax=Streptomyces hirsutus TaxID=35620 RepID=UPI0036CE30BE
MTELYKAGLSHVSVANAAHDAAAETRGKGFDQVRAQSARVWRDALGTVDAAGGSREERVKLSTALYHAPPHPNLFDDVNGQYRGYDGKVHRVAKGRTTTSLASRDGRRGGRPVFPESTRGHGPATRHEPGGPAGLVRPPSVNPAGVRYRSRRGRPR